MVVPYSNSTIIMKKTQITRRLLSMMFDRLNKLEKELYELEELYKNKLKKQN